MALRDVLTWRPWVRLTRLQKERLRKAEQDERDRQWFLAMIKGDHDGSA